MKNLNKELLVNLVIMLAIGTMAFCAGYALSLKPVFSRSNDYFTHQIKMLNVQHKTKPKRL